MLRVGIGFIWLRYVYIIPTTFLDIAIMVSVIFLVYEAEWRSKLIQKNHVI